MNRNGVSYILFQSQTWTDSYFFLECSKHFHFLPFKKSLLKTFNSLWQNTKYLWSCQMGTFIKRRLWKLKTVCLSHTPRPANAQLMFTNRLPWLMFRWRVLSLQHIGSPPFPSYPTTALPFIIQTQHPPTGTKLEPQMRNHSRKGIQSSAIRITPQSQCHLCLQSCYYSWHKKPQPVKPITANPAYSALCMRASSFSSIQQKNEMK